MQRPRLSDYPGSESCLKVRILLAQLGRAYERIEVDIFGGDTRRESFQAVKPAPPCAGAAGRRHRPARVERDPLVPGGRIGVFPRGRARRAIVVRALLFEQEHIGHIAALRFRLLTVLMASGEPRERALRGQAHTALDLLEAELRKRSFLAGAALSIADIAAYCYVHVAPAAAFDLGIWPAVLAWIERVKDQLRFVNDLRPLPEYPIGRGLSI